MDQVGDGSVVGTTEEMNRSLEEEVSKQKLQTVQMDDGAKEGSSMQEDTDSESTAGMDPETKVVYVEIMQLSEGLNPFKVPPLMKGELLEKIARLVQLLKDPFTLEHVDDLELDYSKIFVWIRPLLASSDTKVRHSTLRLFRHFLLETEAIDKLVELRVHIFVIWSLDIEEHNVVERMEALKLCRRIIELECTLLPHGLIRSMVAIASKTDDAFRSVVLETLRQLSIRYTVGVAQCDGIRAMVTAMLDPELKEMSKSLALTLIYLLGQEKSRMYIRSSLDLAAVLSPLTNADFANGDECKRKWKACQNVIILFLKSWTGLLYFASDPNGLASLVEMLVQPTREELKQVVLDTIFLVILHITPFDISVPSKNETKKRAKDLEPPVVDYWGIGPNAKGAKELTGIGFSTEYFPTTQSQPHVVMNQFLAIALVAFTGCGLVDALIELVLQENPPVSKQATQLLSLLMRVSERTFPDQKHWKLFSMSEIVERASQLKPDNSDSQEPDEKLGTRRATRIIELLSSTVGISFESVVATVRARYTFEDAIALNAELGLTAACGCASDYGRQNVGIFPRGDIASLPYTPHLIASLLLDYSLALGGEDGESTNNILASPVYSNTVATSPHHRRGNSAGGSDHVYSSLSGKKSRGSRFLSSIRSPTSLVSSRKRAEKKVLENVSQHEGIHQRMAEEFLELQEQGLGTIAGRTLVLALNNRPGRGGSRPNYPLSNRGHRQHVRTMMLTENAYSDIDNLNMLVYRSKVLQGKDWTKWDWTLVDQIITGPLRHLGLCMELMKTKFIKRILGFFRATVIGEYLVLPWKARYQPYTATCVSLIHFLLDVSVGVDFLRYDRRGKIHKQIVEALQKELQFDDLSAGGIDGNSINRSPFFTIAGKTVDSLIASFTSDGSNGSATIGQENSDNQRIFSPIACSRSMTRGFFAILGAYTSHLSGINLLEEQGLFHVLTELARLPAKDYILRLVITTLDFQFSDICRDWITGLLLHRQISVELNLFILGFLRSLLRREHTRTNKEFSTWIVELLFSQLGVGGSVSSSVVSTLNELVYYPQYLGIIISFDLSPLLPFANIQFAAPLFFKLLSTKRGFQLLQKDGWLDRVTKDWLRVQSIKYAAGYETLMTLKLLCRHEPLTAIPKSYDNFRFHGEIGATKTKTEQSTTLDEESIRQDRDEVFEQAFGTDAALKNASNQLTKRKIGFYPHRIPVRAFEASAKSEPGFVASDLLSLLRIPFTVELWMRSLNGQMSYIPVQSYLDCSHVTGPEFVVGQLETMSNELKGIKLGNGMTFGSKRNETIHRDLCVVAHPSVNGVFHVPKGATLFACLTLAGDPVYRNGLVDPKPEGGGGFMVPVFTNRKRRGSSTSRRRTSVATGGGGRSSSSTTNNNWPLDYSLTTLGDYDSVKDERIWMKCSPGHLNFRSRSLTTTNQPDEEEDDDFGSDRDDDDDDDGMEDDDDDFFDREDGDTSSKRKSANLTNKFEQFCVCPGSNSTATFTFDYDESNAFYLSKVAFHLSLRPECPNAPYIPSHLFGELGKTTPGAKYVQTNGFLVGIINDLLNESNPALVRRSALWCLGHFGSSDPGLSLLLEQPAQDSEGRPVTSIRIISDLAMGTTNCLPLRGTAITVLGLISRTKRGRRTLRELGWDCQPNQNEVFGYIVVPRTFSMVFRPILFSMESRRVWDGLKYPFNSGVEQNEERFEIPNISPDTVRTALECVSRMLNRISLNDAYQTLTTIRYTSKQNEIFKSPVVLLRVHEYLENFTYDLNIRQLILKLFQKHVQFDNPDTWVLLDQS